MLLPLLCVALPDVAAAQDVSLWLDGGAAYARLPGAVSTDAADYGTLSAMLNARGRGLGLDATGYGGWGIRNEASRWVGGEIGLELGRSAAVLRYGARLEGAGLRYRQPFRYSSLIAAARPFLGATLGAWDVRLDGELSRGRWSGEELTAQPLPPLPAPPPATVEGDLSVSGGGLRLSRLLGGVALNLEARALDARNGEAPGTYAGAWAGAATRLGPWSLRGSAGAWTTPDGLGQRGVEPVFEVSAVAGLGAGLAARLSVARDARDPLYGSAGTIGVQVGLSWRVPLPAPAAPLPVVEVGEAAPGGRRVRFRFRGSASSVELLGDFDDWQPEAMRREGGAWVLEKVLTPGVYHFAFRVDGQRWVVPAGAPGVADDGWGRKTASIVIEAM